MKLMNLSKHSLLVGFLALLPSLSPVVSAQTTVTLNATSGSNSIPTNYSATGGLSINRGLPVDLLVVGGGGEVKTATGVQATSVSNSITIGSGGAANALAVGATGGNSTALGVSAAGGGGGGAAGTGRGGTSGSGAMSAITGTNQMYGFGGGGGARLGYGLNGDVTATAPRANSGGGGRGDTAGAAGVVVIRYEGSQSATGGTVATVGSDTVHTFASSGSFTPTNLSSTLSGAISGSGILHSTTGARSSSPAPTPALAPQQSRAARCKLATGGQRARLDQGM